MYFKSVFELEVRYYETDLMGVVHHSNYIRYFECGRNHCMKEIGLPIEKMEQLGVMTPVVSLTCNYKLPAKVGDILKVVSVIEKEPTARIEVSTQIINQRDELVCDGTVTLGFINKETRRPVRAPEFFLEAFRKAK